MLLETTPKNLLVFDLSTFSVKESLKTISALETLAMALEPITFR